MDEKSEQLIPAAASQSYIEKALAHGYNSESLRVESFHSETISQNGGNFCSTIYRLKVSYRRSENAPLEHGNYIVKDLIPMMAALGSSEKLMYEQILPALTQILNRAPKPLGDIKLSATCFYVDRSQDKELYLMEDLGALGYVTLDRHIGLSVNAAQMCLQKLADFHAASMLLIHEQPSLVAQLPPSHFAKGIHDDFTQVLLHDGAMFAADVIEGMPGISSMAAKMRAQLPDEFSKRMGAVVEAKETAFRVICHGDIWLNNVLVNLAEKNALIVDFQNCFLGSPVVDLMFFFYTSLQLEVLLHERDNLLKYYYQRLSETLTALKYPGKIPNYEQLVKEMENGLFYGYYATVCEFPICCAPKEASTDFTVFTFGDAEIMKAKRCQLFENERVLKTLQAIMGQFDAQGVLELS